MACMRNVATQETRMIRPWGPFIFNSTWRFLCVRKKKNVFIRFLDSEGVADIHLADQLVLYMALARGRSTLVAESITEHLLTNIWTIEQFLPLKFDVEEGTGKIGVDGIGF